MDKPSACGRYNLPVDKRYPCDGGNCIQNNVSTPAHKALAYKIATKSTVLAKNDGGLLPLDRTKKLKIALIGGDANDPCVPTIQPPMSPSERPCHGIYGPF